MPEKYLYDRLVEEFGRRTLKDIEIPDSITKNLNPRYELRPYQIDAFQRFICYFTERFEFKEYPSHLLFNMATGSGKTLIMAGLILYLYEQGYRDFLFFVHSTNIIEKTKDNFLNPNSIKYLFDQDIHIANRRVRVTPVANFEAVNSEDINICFTTIQKLHSDMTTDKENALTFEDFRKHRIVLIADEAHHMNVKTKSQQEMFESWENVVERLFTQNEDNLLLEFTATHDYETPAMIEKYRNKVIIRYDLLQFRNDRYSKDVIIARSNFELDERILQALILSQYKQEVAAKYRINLKPVILFKAQRTIAQSQENKANFHRLIEDLSAEVIAAIRDRSDLELIHRAFDFFDAEGITNAQLAERLKREFQEDFCLSVNAEKEKEDYQIIVNTLEDKNNRVRAIFAVKKLNEGWDVLNLFDIVRCYEPRDTGRSKIGATTMSEAQLIGRGARYFPFTLPRYQDRFRRKFDDDIQHELRVLEQLHYHSINDSRYIAEIRQALIAEGMMDETEVICKLKLKEPFKTTNFYKYGVVWFNDRRVKNYQYVQSFADLGVKKRNYLHNIATGHGGMTTALGGERNVIVTDEARRDVKVHDIERNIVQSALARTPFFTFANLKRYFPNLVSMRDFIASEDYLSGLGITFQGNIEGLEENRIEKLHAMLGLLGQIEAEIRANITEYEGTRDFRADLVHEIFGDKELKLSPQNYDAERIEQFKHFVSDKDWFAFNVIYGTSEEEAFVRMLDRFMQRIEARYEHVYLLRNENHFAIYNFDDGRAFQPDFVLFLREKEGQSLLYQLFIEPKGKYLSEHDNWKKDFLKQIYDEFGSKLLTAEDKKYRLIGVPPFYNNEDENKFRDTLGSVLKLTEE